MKRNNKSRKQQKADEATELRVLTCSRMREEIHEFKPDTYRTTEAIKGACRMATLYPELRVLYVYPPQSKGHAERVVELFGPDSENIKVVGLHQVTNRMCGTKNTVAIIDHVFYDESVNLAEGYAIKDAIVRSHINVVSALKVDPEPLTLLEKLADITFFWRK